MLMHDWWCLMGSLASVMGHYFQAIFYCRYTAQSFCHWYGYPSVLVRIWNRKWSAGVVGGAWSLDYYKCLSIHTKYNNEQSKVLVLFQSSTVLSFFNVGITLPRAVDYHFPVLQHHCPVLQNHSPVLEEWISMPSAGVTLPSAWLSLPSAGRISVGSAWATLPSAWLSLTSAGVTLPSARVTLPSSVITLRLELKSWWLS